MVGHISKSFFLREREKKMESKFHSECGSLFETTNHSLFIELSIMIKKLYIFSVDMGF